MSGEKEKCWAHCNCLDCNSPDSEIKIGRYKPFEFIPIPNFKPSPEEYLKFLRINIDILTQEITDHVNKEIERFKKSIKNAENDENKPS